MTGSELERIALSALGAAARDALPALRSGAGHSSAGGPMNGSASAQTNVGGTLQAAEPQVQLASCDVLAGHGFHSRRGFRAKPGAHMLPKSGRCLSCYEWLDDHMTSLQALSAASGASTPYGSPSVGDLSSSQQSQQQQQQSAEATGPQQQPAGPSSNLSAFAKTAFQRDAGPRPGGPGVPPSGISSQVKPPSWPCANIQE